MKTYFPKGQLLLLIIALNILFGCSEEESCPGQHDMGAFDLLQSTKQKFPYQDSIQNIVFRDSLGNEVTAIANRNTTTTFNYRFSQRKCLYDPDQDININARTGTITAFVSIPALNIGFEVNFFANPNFTLYEDDLLFDFASIPFTGSSEPPFTIMHPIPQISIILDQRNSPDQTTSVGISSYTILDKQFLNVFTNTIGADIIKFYYNNEIGIIGFREMPNGTTYVFDRFE